MTRKSRFMVVLPGLYLAISMGNLGCAGAGQRTAAKSSIRAENAIVATLTDVDRDARVVTMKAADGALSTVFVGDGDVVGRMEAGDKVAVERLAALAFQILAPGETLEDQPSTGEALPKGVLFGRKVATTVEILEVAEEGKLTTFRGTDGSVRTMDIATPATRALVASLHPGDDVQVACTEKLAIKLLR